MSVRIITIGGKYGGDWLVVGPDWVPGKKPLTSGKDLIKLIRRAKKLYGYDPTTRPGGSTVVSEPGTI